MEEFRLENDSMGPVRVPVQAYYGAQTQRAVINFQISGIRPWRAFIWSIATIKYGAAKVNCELGLLPQNLMQPITQAAKEIMDGQYDDQFVVDPFQAGAGTSHNMNANEVIANRASQLLGGKPGDYTVNPNDHVNMSQSTNDVIPTAIRLGCLWRLGEILKACSDLTIILNKKAVEFDDVVKSGRTHLQDAVPIRLGQEFGAYACAVDRDRIRILQAAEGLLRIGIGGTATGTGLNASPEYHIKMVFELSKITGIKLTSSDNLFESMQSMSDMVNFSASMRTLAITLIRIANDLRLLASGPNTGLDEIRFPPVQPGSSIMPGKVNPVIAEMLNMAMFHIIGCDTTIALASQAGQLELNVMMPIIAHNLFGMMHIMINSIQTFSEKCVTGLSANREKASNWLDQNSIIATVLNPLIGYAACAEIVKETLKNKRNIKDFALEKAIHGELYHLGTNIPVTEGEITRAFSDLRRMTDGGIFS